MFDFQARTNLEGFTGALRAPVHRVIQWVLDKAQAETFRMFRRPKTGRQYGAHRASAPGEPPARRFGRLEGSADQLFPAWNEGRLRFSASYAGYLEGGTRRMRARSFVAPAAEFAAREARAQFR